MSKKVDETLFDKRAIKKSISKGLVTNGDYKDFLKSLPDESKNADSLKVFTEEEENILTFDSVESKK